MPTYANGPRHQGTHSHSTHKGTHTHTHLSRSLNEPHFWFGCWVCSLMRIAAILLSCTENFGSEAVLQLSGFAKKINASFTCIDCTLPTTQVAMPCFCCVWENCNVKLTHAQSQGIKLPCCLSAACGKLSNQANTCTDCKTAHAHV